MAWKSWIFPKDNCKLTPFICWELFCMDLYLQPFFMEHPSRKTGRKMEMKTGFGKQNPQFSFPDPIQAQRCSRRTSWVFFYPFPFLMDFLKMDFLGFNLITELCSTWELLPKVLDSSWFLWLPLPQIPFPDTPVSSGQFPSWKNGNCGLISTQDHPKGLRLAANPEDLIPNLWFVGMMFNRE